jgi:hypothetical protein
MDFLRRVAANVVIFSDDRRYINHVVELCNSRVVNHYPLRGEIAMTEWLGGTIVIENGKAYHLTSHADGTQHKQQL